MKKHPAKKAHRPGSNDREGSALFALQLINRQTEALGPARTHDEHRGVPRRPSCHTARKKAWTVSQAYRIGRSKHLSILLPVRRNACLCFHKRTSHVVKFPVSRRDKPFRR